MKVIRIQPQTIATEYNSPIVKALHKGAVIQLVRKGMKKSDALRLMRTNADKGYCIAYNL